MFESNWIESRRSENEGRKVDMVERAYACEEEAYASWMVCTHVVVTSGVRHFGVRISIKWGCVCHLGQGFTGSPIVVPIK